MVPQALLLSRDPDVLRVMRRLLDDASVHPHVSYSAVQATGMLRKLKFDSVIVDCEDLDRAGEFLSSLRHAPSSRRAIAGPVATQRMRSAQNRKLTPVTHFGA